MASQSVIGFVGLDQLSLQLASSLLRSGYAVQAFEVYEPMLSRFANEGGLIGSSPAEVSKEKSYVNVSGAKTAFLLFNSHASKLFPVLSSSCLTTVHIKRPLLDYEFRVGIKVPVWKFRVDLCVYLKPPLWNLNARSTNTSTHMTLLLM
ncbi:L-threonate dehydrogenase [Camellia lanceoleosa]|uniref:L-threonate dehydrogenase n=1 Tax=Camellia lanceoleosa TaxID=1840588 RepID=A0ACC0GSA8_9ERIC|nr:L-threonate dehydrogenase [Camellia lanceoleosa]